MAVVTRTLVIVLCFTAPVWAQGTSVPVPGKDTVSQAPVPATPDIAKSSMLGTAMLNQVRFLEGILVTAIGNGADSVATQIHEVAPNLPLFSGRASATGIPIPDYGVLFYVEVPNLREASIILYNQLREPAARPASGTSPAQPVSNPNTPRVMVDPDRVYTEAVRDSLVDAMLDYAGALQLGPDEWLDVRARAADLPNAPGMLTMALRIRGADLLAFRKGPILREEARKKVQFVQY